MRNFIIKTLTLKILLFGITKVNAQEKEGNSKIKLINFHVGPSFGNFLSAEAPHKYLENNWNDQSLIYLGDPLIDYQTNFLSDVRVDFSLGLSFEKYIKNNYSLVFGLNYEGKGIDIEFKDNETYFINENQIYETSELDLKVENKYITAPLLLRKHLFTNQIFYVQGGIYLAYLTSSRIAVDGEKEIKQKFQTSTLTEKPSIPTNFGIKYTDKTKDNTNSLDYGASVGFGIKLPLGNGVYFTSDLLTNIGLRNIDKKYNNDYEKTTMPTTTGINTIIRSGNYYGLNSKAKNINTTFTIGLSFEI